MRNWTGRTVTEAVSRWLTPIPVTTWTRNDGEFRVRETHGSMGKKKIWIIDQIAPGHCYMRSARFSSNFKSAEAAMTAVDKAYPTEVCHGQA